MVFPSEQKILALDIGSKRVGIALWSPLSRLSAPLPALHRKTLKEDLKFLNELIQRESVSKIVVGLPLTLSEKISPSTENALFWIETLKSEFPTLEIAQQDESLSTKEALERLKFVSPKKRDRLKDSFSAMIILEEYLRNEETN